MKGLFILNSDFGVQNTIGARALPIAQKYDKNDLLVLCRDYKNSLKKDFNIEVVVPAGKLIMQILTAIPIYISTKIDTNPLKIKIFEYFLIKKLKTINLKEYDFIHSWDHLPNAYNYIKKQNPDIKIFQDIPIALISILNKIKDKDSFWKNNLKIKDYVKESFEYVNYFIVPSDFVTDSLILEKQDKNKIIKIPFGVDINEFQPKEDKTKKPFRAAFVGNINNRKGIKELTTAWKELELKDAELHLYGRVYPEIKKYLENAEENNIIIHGFCNTKKELPKNHIFVFPSLMEGSAKATYEALASRLPLITTYNAGSVIENGKQGFIIDIQSTKQIKEKILFFYNDDEKLEQFSKEARKLSLLYTWNIYAQRVVNAHKNN